MPLYTPNFQLPYPAPSDEPCDFAEQWCLFSDAFQTQLDDYQSIIDRTTPAAPVARLLITTPTAVIEDQPIPFDTLSVDTAGWVDFDADNSSITTDRGGIFSIVGNVQVASTLVLGREINFTVHPLGFLGVSDNIIDRGNVGETLGLNITGTNATAVPITVYMTVATDAAVPGTVTLVTAHLAVFWHSDRAAP